MYIFHNIKKLIKTYVSPPPKPFHNRVLKKTIWIQILHHRVPVGVYIPINFSDKISVFHTFFTPEP